MRKKKVSVRYIKNKPVVKEPETVFKDETYYRAMYVDWMSDPINRVDKHSKGKFIGTFKCPTEFIRKWEKDGDVQKEIRATVRELFGGGERIKELYDMLWDQAREGRISAIKLALELTGEYIPKMQHMDKPKSLEDLLTRMEKGESPDDETESPSRRLQ